MSEPIICFGQQPCGFFPEAFSLCEDHDGAPASTEIGGEIVFFFHDSDHDPRETATMLRERHTGREKTLQLPIREQDPKQFSPLYAKRILPEWQASARQLPNYVGPELVDHFKSVEAANAADFCHDMYRRMGLLDGIRVERSSDPEFRKRAAPVDDFFVDVSWEGEIVRARSRREIAFAQRRRLLSSSRRSRPMRRRSARLAIRGCVGCNR